MIDLEIEDYEFIEFVMQPLCYLITEKSGDINHWCSQLTKDISEILTQDYNPSLEKKHAQVIEEVLSMLQVLVVRRENLHLSNILKLFWDFNARQINQNELQSKFDEILKLLD